MLKIRRPLGRLIFNMGIAIPGKTVFLIETAPRNLVSMQTTYNELKFISEPHVKQRRKFIWCSSKFYSSDCYKIMHMSLQLCCCDVQKFWSNLISRNWITIKENFHWIRIVSEKLIVKWVEVQYKHMERIIPCNMVALLQYTVIFCNSNKHTKYNLI